MNYTGIIVIILSFLSIIIGLFAIWLAIVFYRLYTQLSLMVTEMSKGLEVSTIRLERLPKILYNQDIIFPKSSSEDKQNININKDSKEKKEQSNIQPLNADNENIAQKQDKDSKNKMQDRDFASQILPGGEEI